MAKPSRERVQRWRERKAKKGGRSLSTWLEPETVQMMDYLLNHYGETAAPLIARAIASLYGATCNEEGPQIPSQSDSLATATVSAAALVDAGSTSGQESPISEPESKEPEMESLPEYDATDSLLSEIKERIAQGESIRILQRTLLVEWIKSMQKRDLSFQAMAERLNAAQIPTFSGRGEWEQGMIPTILLLSSY